MKFINRLITSIMSFLLLFTIINTTTVQAAETRDSMFIQTNEISQARSSILLVDDTFNISGSHRGASRTYNYNTISFECSITDQNGNAIPSGSTILAVRLYDDTDGAMKEWQTSTNKIVITLHPISNGHQFHFEYLIAYGTSNVRVHMQIYGNI